MNEAVSELVATTTLYVLCFFVSFSKDVYLRLCAMAVVGKSLSAPYFDHF